MNGKRPNVLLITADQLRYDCLGASGRYPVRTPHLDALAGEGAMFTSAFSHFPVCGPARQSLLHGRRAETFGALWNFSGALPTGSLQPEAYTWSRALAEDGYTSAFLGKWGVHPTLGPQAFGYHSYISEADYARFARSRYPEAAYSNGFFGETNPIPLEHAQTHWLADRATETMEKLEEGGGPWHMALHFPEPHLPCRPSDRFAAMYDPAEVREWDGFRETFAGKPYIQRQQLYNWGIERYEWDDWAPVVARYYGIISQMDEAVGRVLEKLRRIGAADRTIVVFTADHGDMCGSHRMMDKHYIMYDDVVHVPLLLRWPQVVQGGTRRDELVYNLLDIPPTLLELSGAEPPPPGHWHGASLVPLLSGQQHRSPSWRDEVVASYNGQQFGLYSQRMIRTDAWKYVWNCTDIDELYDLTADPAELVNRIGDKRHADLTASLRRRLYERLLADGDALVANEWMRHQLLHGAKHDPAEPFRAGRG
ncbi:sulfatase-like hydrolase/transferase [Paenibacillus hodogayensis]|uniref:Sulfatase-like hydrolase/transferase n=1 Tax=Paenibacillus hodogayensis TaxID=279208 RepID=A0ABV5VQ33_9BACL